MQPNRRRVQHSPKLISGWGPAFYAGNHDLTSRGIDIEKDASVPDSPTEAFETSMEFVDITLKRILSHSFDCSIYAG
jgi:hypothetical protein